MPWTLSELVDQVAERLAALPPPKNGQVRAVPDDRTVRYYGTIGLLDRPVAMRGRTALYGARHLAQVVAIKRLQSSGKSLAEIQELWPSLDDPTLARMSGVTLPATAKRTARKEFWKAAPELTPAPAAPRTINAPVELRLQLAPNVTLTIAVDDTTALALSQADVRALRAAAAPLVTELANRRLTPHAGEEDL